MVGRRCCAAKPSDRSALPTKFRQDRRGGSGLFRGQGRRAAPSVDASPVIPENFLVRRSEKALNPKPSMHPDQTSSAPGQTRRQFIRKTGMATAIVAGSGLIQFPLYAKGNNPVISIVRDHSDQVVRQAPVQWAVGHLQDTLAARGMTVLLSEQMEQVPPMQECILVAGPASNLARPALEAAGISLPTGPESLAIARGTIKNRPALVATGSDARGLTYAVLELADRVRFADNPLIELRAVRPVSEKPANSIRSVMRAFVSNVQDKPWYNDRAFWQAYLTMLATHRFNRFNLAFGLGYDFTTNITDCYFHFAYPFLVSVPGYDVRAVPLSDAERDRNLEMLRFISEETERRGLHFQLGLWTHAYKWTDSPHANYVIEGLTPETQASYCRDALRTVLKTSPAIRGVTIRTHGESGVPEGAYGLWKTIFEGAAQCGRRVEIDLHAKGVNQRMINTALETGLPVNVSPKFWAEHMGLPYMQGAIRALEMPPKDAPKTGFFALSAGSRSFMRYGYGDLLTADRRYGVLHRCSCGVIRKWQPTTAGFPASAAATVWNCSNRCRSRAAKARVCPADAMLMQTRRWSRHSISKNSRTHTGSGAGASTILTANRTAGSGNCVGNLARGRQKRKRP
jgi:hypothetical protein